LTFKTPQELEREEFDDAVEGIRRGLEDVKAGRTLPASEVLADLRRKLKIPPSDRNGPNQG
jgi:predicted transcriptional regulator